MYPSVIIGVRVLRVCTYLVDNHRSESVESVYPSVTIGVRVLRVCNHGSESVESVCIYIYPLVIIGVRVLRVCILG